MNKKSSLMLTFFVTFVIGLLLYGGLAIVWYKYARTTNKAYESFNQLTGHINAMKDRRPGEVELIFPPLIMDPETMIAVFNEGTRRIDEKVPVKLVNLRIQHEEEREIPISINRPPNCKITENCICLIKEFSVSLASATDPTRHINYEQAICNPLELTISYLGRATIIRTENLGLGEDVHATQRNLEIFIERGSGTPGQGPVYFGLCETSPCLP